MIKIHSIELPLPSDKAARWEMKVDLSGKRYGFYIAYNTRQDAWFMSILDVNGELLIAGLRLVTGTSFLDKYRASVPELPPGELHLADREAKKAAAEVTRDNLNNRFALVYTVYEEE
ncbi:MAG: hypothetical protein LBU82_04910 [Treponema sp.]|nr:hypothetical protein [Treponema sp.]